MKVNEGILNLGFDIEQLMAHESNYTEERNREVQYLVLHYTGNSNDRAKNNAVYFTEAGRKASAHFFVDEEIIYQSVPLNCVAWHCGDAQYKHLSCRNSNSIGIEMCCSGDYKVSDATKAKAVKLIAALCKLMGVSVSQIDTYVLRHYDITGKLCPAQMAGNHNSEWKNFKESIKAVLAGFEQTEAAALKMEAKEGCNVNVPVLEKGDSGSSVRALQILLIGNGQWCGGYGADGKFGSGTEASVRAYQKVKGLRIDGIVGNDTWSSLLKS